LTLGELLKRTARRLRRARLHYGHGTVNARDEAAFIVFRGLGLPFDARLNGALPPAGLQRVEALIRRRIKNRIPAAYLLNEAWLDGHSFLVDRRVIVPRSHIAELLGAHLRPWLQRAPRRVLDLCTGSACLAILAALAFPRAQVDATDISPAALAVARKNVTRYRLKRRVHLLQSNLFNTLEKERYDLIVTNPPYVATRSMRKLPPEYRYEPGIALAGGRSGLDFVSRILADARDYLRPGGLLVCEIGAGRRALERAYPGIPFLWPREAVFILERADLASAARTASSTRKRSTRARARQ
jgi:ribosomal protein L3 glutamine methyltransferase